MPNIVGGDQFHPAYDPRTELKPNQVLHGSDLYTVTITPDNWISAEIENVDGYRHNARYADDHCPAYLLPVVNKLREKGAS